MNLSRIIGAAMNTNKPLNREKLVKKIAESCVMQAHHLSLDGEMIRPAYLVNPNKVGHEVSDEVKRGIMNGTAHDLYQALESRVFYLTGCRVQATDNGYLVCPAYEFPQKTYETDRPEI